MYLLKSVACLALFFIFYKLLLEKESIHKFKRFYLLGSLVASFGIPLIKFTTYTDVSETINPILISNTFDFINSESNSFQEYLPIILLTFYCLGVLFFSFRFIKNLLEITQKIKYNTKVKKAHFINVLLFKDIVPHTFFNYIFLNKQKYESHTVPEEVLLHEQAHAKQKHSVDVLLIELLQIVFWFNPLLFFINKSIKLNHEFLADRAVLNQGIELNLYQNLLLEFSSNSTTPKMANSINYSLIRSKFTFEQIKKRFTVMNTQTSKTRIWVRSFLLVPLVALLLYSFSSKVEVNIMEETNSSINNQDGATKKQLATYNKLAKKYNAIAKEDRIILLKDLEKLEYIYGLMTDEQKRLAKPFPECFPPPPPPPPIPPNTGSVKINGKTFYYLSENGKTRYYTKFGKEVDKNGKLIKVD